MVRHLSLAALIVVAACSGPKLPPPNSAEAYYDARQQAVHVAMSRLAPPQSATLVSASGFHYQAPALSLLSGPHVAYNPPPIIGLGIGGFGFGSSGVGFGSGAGVGIPVGKPTVAEVSDQYIASAILPTPVDYRTNWGAYHVELSIGGGLFELPAPPPG